MTYTRSQRVARHYPRWVGRLAPAGKVVAITGTTTGIGHVAARTAVEAGAACVIALNRASVRADASTAVLRRVAPPSVEIAEVECDLTSFSSVRRAVAEVRDLPAVAERGLDVLALNAGIMAFPERTTEDGFDVQVQTNFLSHFLLAAELTDDLRRAARGPAGHARVVTHTSAARRSAGGQVSPRHLQPVGPAGLGDDDMARYAQTKLALAVFGCEHHRRLNDAGSTVWSLLVEPGLADTDLLVSTAAASPGFRSGEALREFMADAQSAEDGALPMLMAMFSPEARPGQFWAPSEAGALGPYTKGPPHTHVPERVLMEPGVAAELWAAAERAVGATFEVG